ncbi:MAG: hypothetical protein A2020_04475 [Lentisphaerae bacterium GWF2_45_14]|nr:MAG: hypothetical protein A2020_04475 [Lentisphaerae bacterium GWF2_45_14]
MLYDCIIIGAGLSGLAAGIRMAHFGKKVCICEQHDRPGGLNSYYNMKSFEMETGLHAMTNFAKGDSRSSTLCKLLRQLRIPYEALELREQNHSLVQFPEKTLRFSNNFSEFENSVADNFPDEIDSFKKLDAMITGFNELDLSNRYMSSRLVLDEHINDELLRNMLLCPMMYYGSASADDMDFSMFALLYKSIFKEGLSRPAGQGIRLILKLLKERFTESGGEIKLNTPVRKIVSKDGVASGVVTAKGEFLECKNVLSSAGYLETVYLCDQKPAFDESVPPGEISFIETIAVMEKDIAPEHKETILFFNSTEEFKFNKPETLTSLDSGIICFPMNFKFKAGDQTPGYSIRASTLANCDYWINTPDSNYKQMKAAASSMILKKTSEVTGIDNIEENALMIDTATPRTYFRFSGHINGAIYGTPFKIRDGRTYIDNLYICGTDQGFLGITGAMFSGITIANIHLLK